MEYKHAATAVMALLLLNPTRTNAQVYTLSDLLQRNHMTTGEAILISERLINEYDKHLFNIQTRPKIHLSATLPSLTNSISPITLGDGSEKFVNRFYMNSSASLSISQLIPFTGGTLSFSSGLTRLDNFTPQRTKSFNYNMFNISYSQSISPFNQYRWDKRIHDKQNDIFTVSQIQGREKINLSIIDMFFDLLTAQKKEELTTVMKEYSTLIYEKSQAMHSQGRISQSDLWDAEITLKRFDYSTSQKDRIHQQKILASKLNLEDEEPVIIFDFDSLESISLSYDTDEVIERAVKYGAALHRELEQTEENSAMVRIKAAGLPSISLSFGGGFNAHDEAFSQLIDAPSRNISATVSISIPILSWGENRYRVNRLIEQHRIADLRYSDTVQDLIASCQYELECLPLLLESILAYKATLRVLYAQLQESTDLYYAGRLSRTRLHDLQRDIIQAELSRINQTRQFFHLQYKFRITALYDVILNIPIIGT